MESSRTTLPLHKMGLVGGFRSFNPLKNHGVSWDDDYSQYMGKGWF